MSEIHDLRSYLQVLESAGQLVRIGRPVSLDHELADVAAALERQSGPAPLFEHTTAADRGGGPIAAWPVFSSAVANQTRAALALDCAKGAVVEVMGRALSPANAIQPVRVDERGLESQCADRRRGGHSHAADPDPRGRRRRAVHHRRRDGQQGPGLGPRQPVVQPDAGQGAAGVRLQPQRVAAHDAVPQGAGGAGQAAAGGHRHRTGSGDHHRGRRALRRRRAVHRGRDPRRRGSRCAGVSPWTSTSPPRPRS